MRRGTSLYRGVHYDTKKRKWVAGIQIREKKMHLGSFNNEWEAARAYNTAAKKYFGSGARLNKEVLIGEDYDF